MMAGQSFFIKCDKIRPEEGEEVQTYNRRARIPLLYLFCHFRTVGGYRHFRRFNLLLRDGVENIRTTNSYGYSVAHFSIYLKEFGIC